MYATPMSKDDSPEIKLYVVHHKDINLPNIPALTFLRSDLSDSENIADKADYCELRAQYYIWKNKKSDYVGFFQYRRYLEFAANKLIRLPIEKRPAPYRIRYLPKLSDYSVEPIHTIVPQFDIIAPVWEYTGIPVWKRYAAVSGQRRSDLELIYDIIKRKFPAFCAATDKYLNGKGEYYGNIFIMKWQFFDSYCRWLFDILAEFDGKAINPLPRTDGYLGERLFGIYFTWLCSQPEVKCAELPRVHFYGYDDAKHRFFFARFVNSMLPPGSGRRAALRQIIKQ